MGNTRMDGFLLLVLTILFSHWVSDFVLQSHWMATNKSKSWLALSTHVAVYTFSMGASVLLISVCLAPYAIKHGLVNAVVLDMAPKAYLCWVVANGVLHLATDAVTSRITSALWRKGDYHNFFVVVGFDQLMHYTCLLLTLWSMWTL